MDSSVDLKNLVIAFGLSVLIVFAWQMIFPQQPTQPAAPSTEVAAPASAPASSADVTRLEDARGALAHDPRIMIKDPDIIGSFPTVGKGFRLDNLILNQYRQSIDPNSPPVTLLTPSNVANAYFAEFGWVSSQKDITLPGPDTRWATNGGDLSAGETLTMRWTSPERLIFTIDVELSDEYLFTIKRTVENNSRKAALLRPYSLLNREYIETDDHYLILHEGPFGVFDQTLEEVTYSQLRDDGSKTFDSIGGWTGISDKYFFTAVLPEQDDALKAQFRYYRKAGYDRYQIDYSREATLLNAGETHSTTTRLFAGPKRLSLLDRYAERFSVPLFDRAVDFGVLYFITRPLFLVLQSVYHVVGNFGIAIMILTVFIRILLFPLANKSYKAIAHMRTLQPKIMELRERYEDDRMMMNQELMKLYKNEKVNPMAGCLPLLVQIPIFFALYKVLFVTIEMRHAPFFGWIQDLSAKDPTSMFNLFGLIPWDPPSMLQIGVWPLLMAITMIVQQRLNPAPTDPMQEKMLKALPYFFLFLFAQFPRWIGDLLDVEQFTLHSSAVDYYEETWSAGAC